MPKRISLFALLLILALLPIGFSQTASVVYQYDFESGYGSWSVDNGIWQIGTPTVGPKGCHGGNNCAGTGLSGNYPANTSSSLISPSIQLPAVTSAEEIHLRFWQWFNYAIASYEDDRGQVRVSTYNATTGIWSGWQDVGAPSRGLSPLWSLKDIDLTSYAGKKIRIAFAHIDDVWSSDDVSLGWFIDDIEIIKKTPQFTGNFENGWGDWTADNGIWEIGAPSKGPSTAHGGTQCASTGLNDNYPANTSSSLLSPTIQLPAVTGSEEIHLRFWQWFNYPIASYEDDRGQVRVSTYNATTGVWSGWQDVGAPSRGLSPLWSLKDIDLTSYAGKKIRIAFAHIDDVWSSDDVSLGWYIDDIEITGLCTYSITPTSKEFGSAGGTGSVNVTASSNCTWTAASNVDWIKITSGSGGIGNGTVNYSVVPTMVTRTGTCTIAGQIFAITQTGRTSKDDLLGIWSGTVWQRNSDTGEWASLTSGVTKIAVGDLDGDGFGDLIGVWPSNGTWVRYSENAEWAKLGLPAESIATGDLNGDGKEDLLGVWQSEIRWRDSATGAWTTVSGGASKVVAGDLDGDGKDDIVGDWPAFGVWVKTSGTGNWAPLASKSESIATGKINNDGKADLLGIWDSTVYWRDSDTGKWEWVASGATQIVSGDIDGDGRDDIIGIWPTSGVWVRYAGSGRWERLSASVPEFIAIGRMR